MLRCGFLLNLKIVYFLLNKVYVIGNGIKFEFFNFKLEYLFK